MNSIQDPSKKTSINSLLNPEASSAVAFSNQIPNLPPLLGPNRVPPQIDSYPGSFANGAAPFHLRAADWSDKRKHEGGTTGTQRHYQQPTIDTPEVYVEGQSPRIVRPPVDEGGTTYPPMAGEVWPTYGAPVIAPLYSDERTGELDASGV